MKCIICDSRGVKIKYRLEGRDVFECQKCGLEMLVNHNPFFYNEKYYEKNYFSEGFQDKDFYKKITDKLNLGRKEALLDIGCGKGEYLNYLFENCSHARKFANDLKNNLSDKNIVEKIFEGDFNDITFNEHFNAITMWDLFEHVDNPAELLSKALNLLTNKGKIFIYTVNSDCLVRKIGNIFYRMGYKKFIEKLYPPYHLFYFNEKNLKMISEKLDMDIGIIGYKYYNTRRMEISLMYKIAIKLIYFFESRFSDKKTNIYSILIKK